MAGIKTPTPTTTAELNDMAWAMANGQRVVADLEHRARSLLDCLDRLDEKGELAADGSLTFYRRTLREMLPGMIDDD